MHLLPTGITLARTPGSLMEAIGKVGLLLQKFCYSHVWVISLLQSLVLQASRACVVPGLYHVCHQHMFHFEKPGGQFQGSKASLILFHHTSFLFNFCSIINLPESSLTTLYEQILLSPAFNILPPVPACSNPIILLYFPLK